METVRSVLGILEQQLVVVTLLRDVLDSGLSVAIGAEHGYEPLASCAVVVAPVVVDGRDGGAVGLLGPTRMNYPQALAAAHLVGEGLSRRLQRSRGSPGRRAGVDACPLTPSTTSTSCWASARRRATTRSSGPTASKARELHPDANDGDATAEARFKEVSLAYEVLRDPERRARYDRFGPEGVFGQGAGVALRLRRRPGRPLRGVLRVDGRSGPGPAPGPGGRAPTPRSGCSSNFAEAAFGARKEFSIRLPVVCDTCSGSGRGPGTQPVRCPDCQGAGEIRRIRQSLLGQVVTAVACSRCQGLGELTPTPCAECRGEGRRMEDRSFVVEVPRRRGGRLHAAPGRPRAGRPTGRAQRVALRPPAGRRPTSASSGRATTCTPPCTWASPRRRSGPRSRWPRSRTPRELTIPAGTQGGHVVRLKGGRRPAPARAAGAATSASTWWSTPRRGSAPKQEELLAQLAAERGEEVGGTEGTRACSPASVPPSAEPVGDPDGISVRAAAAAQVFVGDPAHPVLAGGRPPPPRRCCGSPRRGRGGERRARAVWCPCRFGGAGEDAARTRRRRAPRAARGAPGHRGLRAGQGGPPRVGGPEADRARRGPDRGARDRPLGGALGGAARRAVPVATREVAAEAAAQSRRVLLPEILGPQSLRQLAEGSVAGRPGRARRRPRSPGSPLLAVGPEGDGAPASGRSDSTPWASASTCCGPRRRRWPAPWCSAPAAPLAAGEARRERVRHTGEMASAHVMGRTDRVLGWRTMGGRS